MAIKHDLVDDVLKWYNHKKYVRLGSDYSVTDLLKPVRIVHLEERYKPQIQVKNIDMILPSLIGSATHDGLQQYLKIERLLTEKYMIERRLLNVIRGRRIAGRFDVFDAHKEYLYDIKVTTVWKYLNGGREEWEEQLNMYRYMMHTDSIDVRKLFVWLIMKDWKPSEVWKHSNYPKNKQDIIELPIWELKDAKRFMEKRVEAIKSAESLSDDLLPDCTPEQRWAKREVWKLYRKPNNKRATKNFDNEARAKAYRAACIKNNPSSDWPKSVIRSERAEPFKRCQEWCSVADFCDQYKAKRG